MRAGYFSLASFNPGTSVALPRELLPRFLSIFWLPILGFSGCFLGILRKDKHADMRYLHKCMHKEPIMEDYTMQSDWSLLDITVHLITSCFVFTNGLLLVLCLSFLNDQVCKPSLQPTTPGFWTRDVEIGSCDTCMLSFFFFL
ncbi:hypothetical protein J3458_001008 [Metarhizium acridum]|uniref:uncharacterized protein n=1 Tax=Metarhizium acridum TaxID=92637 RepID=UPI001C6D1853|nr:hypothetical protein J3458_001008 [Metarhizium acridum]